MVFIKSDSTFKDYFMLPRSVANMPDLSLTAKMIYARLHDRCKVSQKNKWVDAEGNVYIIYTIATLAEDMQLKVSAIQRALKSLEENDLILRQHQGLGLPNRIYVKAPLEFMNVDDASVTDEQPENTCQTSPKRPARHPQKDLSDNSKDTCETGTKVDTNKTNKNKTNIVKSERTPHGDYKNVMLSEDEYQALKQDIPKADKYIQDLSCYMQSKGVSYPDHDATIRNWYRRDQDKQFPQSESKARGNNYNDFPQRTYDMSALEKVLLKYGTN